MSNIFLDVMQLVQKLYSSSEYNSIKSLLSSLVKEFMVKNYENINIIINAIKSTYSGEKYRELYILFNMIYDPFIENGYKSIYTYNISNIQKAITHFNNPNKKLKKSVIISTTTCKRTDLVQKTIDSFLECALDYIDYVQEWIIIDDNSSQYDRDFMKSRYPFITYIYKNENEKGHPKSMNIIRDYVISKNADYLFNMEDDWEFFIKDNIFEKMVNGFSIKNSGQCLLNINYAEDTKSGNTLWGAEQHCINSSRYFIHRFYQGNQLEEEVKRAGYQNCFYWPHFSFRVGLTSVNVLKEIGPFDENSKHFEMEYAYRYVQKGYKTTFLDGIFCSHIGRRTYERNTNKLNAYDLNNEQQFGEPLKKNISGNPNISNPDLGSGNQQSHQPQKEQGFDISNKIMSEIVTYVINLERRFDRLQAFFEQNRNEHIPVQVFYGFDGKNMPPSHKIQKAFKSGDYNYRVGIVGCAISHIVLWKKFLQEQNQSYMIVLEDDAKLCRDFKTKLMYLLETYKNQFEIMFLHHNPYQRNKLIELNLQSKIPIAEEWSVERSMRENMGSTAGYIITRDGARNMLKHVEKYGMYNAVDWVMFKSPNDKTIKQRIMYTNPMLVQANCFQTANGIDTDVQNVFIALKFNGKLDWDKSEIKDLSNILIKNSYDNDKKIVFMVDDEIEKNEHYMKDAIELAGGKENIVKNSRKYIRIMFLNTPKQGYIKDGVCIIPIYNLSNQEIISIKNKLNDIVNNSAVEYYTTDNYIYTVPQIFMTEDFRNSKVWGDGYLNTVSPF